MGGGCAWEGGEHGGMVGMGDDVGWLMEGMLLSQHRYVFPSMQIILRQAPAVFCF